MTRTMILIFAMILLPTSALAEDREWRFRVFLGDREIGTHQFILTESDGRKTLLSEASFEYRLLFIKLYQYQHRNTETWSGNCLVSIESSTDANGEPYRVSGQLKDGRFALSGSSGEADLPACSMSFAYWNPEFLRQEQLINTQNGEVVQVVVSNPELVQLEVRGDLRKARKYQLRAGKMLIDLWYSENNEWLALESDARGGRRLRYELM